MTLVLSKGLRERSYHSDLYHHIQLSNIQIGHAVEVIA